MGDLVINYAQNDGFTPLMFASENGHVEIVKLLLTSDANVNARALGFHNLTALIQASQSGYTEIVRLLLDAGANVDFVRKDGVTPLMVASEQGYLDVVKLLLEKNPVINAQAQGCGNCTALCLASENGHTEIVRLLLENGANVDLARGDGATPLLIASQNVQLDVIKLLLTAISDEDAKRLTATIFSIKQSAQEPKSAMNEIIDPMIKIFFAERIGRAHAMMSKKNNAEKDAFDLYADGLAFYPEERDAIRKGNMESLPEVLKKDVEEAQIIFNPTDSEAQDELKALIESNMASILE